MSLKEIYNQTISFLAYCKRVIIQTPFFGVKGLKVVFFGFTPNKIVLYGGDLIHKRRSYISDYQRYVKSPLINLEFRYLFNNKLFNYYFLKNYSDKICPVLYFIDNNKTLHAISKNEGLYEEFVYKPNTGWGGKGVSVKNKIDKSFSHPNYIIVPKIDNHYYAKEINPNSLNTIRILTCILNGAVHIISTIRRFGVKQSENVDNFSNGGISALVDKEKGIILNAVRFINNKKYNIETHPDTGNNIKGIQIPYWETILNEITKLHSRIIYVKYIAWDVAVTKDSYVIIEANHVSDLDLIQCHGGVLFDIKTKNFYNSVL